MGLHLLNRKIAYRLYLATMRYEAMWWLSFRRWCLDQLLGRKHRNVNIFPNVFIEGWEGLSVGDNVSFNRGCNISAGGGLKIGNYVSIGHGTSIITSEHGFSRRDIPIQVQPVVYAPVLIEDDVYIGCKATLISGVTIGSGSVIGAASVVTKDVPANSVVAGVPARVIRLLRP